jgi:hypothetical protein
MIAAIIFEIADLLVIILIFFPQDAMYPFARLYIFLSIQFFVLSKKWVTLSVLEESVVVWGEIGAS